MHGWVDIRGNARICLHCREWAADIMQKDAARKLNVPLFFMQVLA